MSRSSSALFLGAALGAASCGNPAVDSRIEALGGEREGVEPSEYHRPGQPCVLCHGEYGGDEPLMTLGGTVFATPTAAGADPLPVADVDVKFIDSFGEVYPPPGSAPLKTNCIGNFFVTKDQWDPGFPLIVEIQCPPPAGRQKMTTRIARDGSCATCHFGDRNQGSAGWVYCGEPGDQFPAIADSCPGKP